MKKAVCRKCRREQIKLFLKGERCLSPKCSFSKRNYPPGHRGANVFGKPSEFARQLRAKQKMRLIYGISERQLKNYYQKASQKKEETGETLLQLLETRLDNVVFKLSFASSRAQARQLVSHKKIMVNEKVVNFPLYEVKIGDKIQLIGKKKLAKAETPVWLNLDKKNQTGEVIKLPNREEIAIDIDEQSIIQYYSR